MQRLSFDRVARTQTGRIQALRGPGHCAFSAAPAGHRALHRCYSMVAAGPRQPGQHRALHALFGQRRNYHPSLCGPLYDKPFPKDWIVYIAILLPVSVFSRTFGGVLNRLILGRSLSTLANWKSGDIPHASLICIAIGLVTFAFASNRARLQAANAQLSQQVQYGRRDWRRRPLNSKTHSRSIPACFREPFRKSLVWRSVAPGNPPAPFLAITSTSWHFPIHA